jgi:hypothetical protein
VTAATVTRALQAAGGQLGELARDALRQQADETVRIAAARAPRETGELANSIFVRVTENAGAGNVTVDLGFRAEHAAAQHEDMSLQHDDGEPKFLERTLMERKDSIAAALGSYLRGAVGAG